MSRGQINVFPGVSVAPGISQPDVVALVGQKIPQALGRRTHDKIRGGAQ